MTKLDSNELVDELEKLQLYDMVSIFYEQYMDKCEYGDYIKIKDVEKLIEKLIHEANHRPKNF